ncbi:MAG TPA: ADP-ribosyltransferase domain-containing protein [Kofleriaceae bacterium]|nr:ADP-ribosyltransferase domain-containing protein [Kofleriaceae bacterium]
MLDTALAQGLHVPVVISDDPTKYKHYVVVTARFDSGAGVYYRFHNTADGKAVWVMQHQIASGQMPLNGGTMITAIEQPRRAGSGGGAAESRAPAVPQVATAAMQAVTQRMPAQVAAQVINAEMGTQAATPDAAHAASPPPTSTEAAQRPTLVMPAVQDAVAELVHPQAQAATAELMQPRQPGTRQRTGDPERDVFTDKWKDRQVDAAQLRRKYDFEYDDAVDKINRVKANPEVAAVLARVPEAELVAILLYTSTHFVEMNKALRTADASKLDDVGDAIALASAGLEKMPVYQGWTYRGVDSLPAEVLAKYVPGQTVTEEAFTSSSYAESGQYAGNVQFRIKSKDGRLVESLSRYDNEKEVLFKPGSKFKVVDKERDGDRVVITMEEVEGDGGAVAPGAAPRSRAEQSDLGERTPGVRAHETATRAASGEDAPQTRTTHPEAAVEVEHKTVRERTWTGTDTRSRSAPTDRQAHVPVLDHGAAVLNRLSPGIGERLARAKQPVLEAQHQLDKLTTERDELAGQSWQWNEGYLKDHPHERTAVAKAKERAAEVDAEIAALERKLPVLRDRALNEIAVHMEKLRKALQTGTKQDAQEAKQIGNTFPISSDAQSMLAKQSTKHSFNAEQYLRDQIASYNRMTRKGPRGDGFEIVAEEAKADHYNADKKQLNFYVTLNANYHTAAALKEALTRAVFHEMTHHWEYADRETSKASHQWRGARAEAAGTPDPVDVQLKPADAASKGGVIKALLGDFLWEYVGRLYPGKPSTEVYTEGVERFATGKQMAELFAIDPEQFYLVLGTLK